MSTGSAERGAAACAEARDEQVWSSETYQAHARFVSEYGAALLDWLAAQPGERILDLGCGEGALAEQIAALGADVTGLDGSAAFVAAARARGLKAEQGDGHRLPYEAAFDAVFSNAALHWMTDPDAVLAGVHRALVPGGRFVAEMGGHGNVAAIVTALLAVARSRGLDERIARPWYFPTVQAQRARLEAAGFAVDRIVLFARPTPLSTRMEDWLATFREPLFAAAGADRDAAMAEAVALLAPSLQADDGAWTADYVRLRFAAHKRDIA